MILPWYWLVLTILAYMFCGVVAFRKTEKEMGFDVALTFAIAWPFGIACVIFSKVVFGVLIFMNRVCERIGL